MRRFTVLATLLLGLAWAGVAMGGSPARSPGGEFTVLDVDVIPGQNKAAKKAGSVSVEFHGLYAKTDGSRPRDSGTQIRFDKSLRFHNEDFPSCDRAVLEAQGPTACPAGSQIGTGTGVADLRPGGPSSLAASLTLFNGTPEAAFPSNGDQLLLIHAIPEGTTSGIVFYFIYRQQSGPYRTVLDGGPAPGPSDPDSALILTGFDVEVPSRTIKTEGKNGKKVTTALIEARPCKGGFRSFQLEEAMRGGELLTATDISGCAS
jgi:hypothetical protein